MSSMNVVKLITIMENIVAMVIMTNVIDRTSGKYNTIFWITQSCSHV
jgi:hypothetical protein